MRRVYRAHEILDISVNADGDEMSVDWSFRFRDTAPKDSPVRKKGETCLNMCWKKGETCLIMCFIFLI